MEITIERPLTGQELARRMKGWVTVEPQAFCEVVEPHGWLKLFDDGGLVVEVEDEAGFKSLQTNLTERFGDQVDLELLKG